MSVTRLLRNPRLPARLDPRSFTSSALQRRRQRWQVARVPAVMEFLQYATSPQDALISVIMPTRNRCQLLPRAISSVLSQRHRRWELIVVDDGSEDGTQNVLEVHSDDRITKLRLEGVGSAVARNAGLRRATGDFVAYLDDDNLMHPLWLHAVAWAFSRWPATDTLYGARIVDGGQVLAGMENDPFPQFHFLPFSHRRLRRANFIDLGVFAHRRDLSGALFDTDYGPCDDWDFILRLTTSNGPLAVPAVACFYSTDAPNRHSTSARAADEFRAIARRSQLLQRVSLRNERSRPEGC